MQVDGERLLTNKGPIMVKESNNFQNCLLRGQYLAINVTKRSKTAQNRKYNNIIPLYGFLSGC